MVQVEHRSAVLVVTLDRPERRNAVDGATTALLAEAFDRFEVDTTLAVCVLTGAGGTFCAGADLRAGPAGERIVDGNGFASLTRRRRSKPVVAAVEGAAHAGGFEVVLACDLVVAARDASFALPEVKRGVLAGSGLWRLPRHVALPAAAHVALTGEPMPAERAYHLGLVSELTTPGQALESALDLAHRIASNAPGSVRESLRVLRDSRGLDDEECHAMAAAALRRLAQTDDFKEGPRAFVEHRPPRWRGR